MKSLVRRNILQKGRLARRVVASAIVMSTPMDIERYNERYSNVAQILARANQFGSLPFVLVRRAKDVDARTSEQREFLSRMGKWMVEKPGQAYMKQLVIPLLQADEDVDLATLFKWMDDETKVEAASRFLDLGDSPILDYMVSLKLANVDAIDDQDVLPISFLEDRDVKLAHHNFLIDFFFEMLPNLLVNSSSSTTRFEDLSNEIDTLYNDYNGFSHVVARAILEKKHLFPFIAVTSDSAEATSALESVISGITGKELPKANANQSPFFGLDVEEYLTSEIDDRLGTILNSIANVLGVQIVTSVVFHLKIFSDSNTTTNPFAEVHLTHLLRWVGFLYPGYIIEDAASLVNNTNLAEHDEAISRLGTLMEALSSRTKQLARLTQTAKSKK